MSGGRHETCFDQGVNHVGNRTFVRVNVSGLSDRSSRTSWASRPLRASRTSWATLTLRASRTSWATLTLRASQTSWATLTLRASQTS